MPRASKKLLSYIEFQVYPTLRFWRVVLEKDTSLFLDNGWVDNANLKTPHFYLRGSEHFLTIISTWAHQHNFFFVRCGTNLSQFRLYVPHAVALYQALEFYAKPSQQIPFVVLPVACLDGQYYFRPCDYFELVKTSSVGDALGAPNELYQKLFALVAQNGSTNVAAFCFNQNVSHQLYSTFAFIFQNK